MVDITSLIDRINAAAAAGSTPGIIEDAATRFKLLKAAQDLVSALKPPDMVVADVAFSAYHFTSVRLALEMGVFERLVMAGRPLPVTELAASRTADTALVLRIARSLVGTGFLADARTADGRNAFAITAAGRQAIVPCARAGLKFHFDQNLGVVSRAPDFFRARGFRIPEIQKDGLFQYVHQTDQDCYTYWSRQPGVMENFNTFMQGYFGSGQLVNPISWFPYDEVCFNGFDPSGGSEYIYVDVGGGKGHHSQEVLSKYPNAPGRFLLQDLAQVIEDIDKTPGIVLSDRIERSGHDFFQPQPIRGARTYALENVLHNWNDVSAKKILQHIRDAMKPGYSKVVVQGIVMSDTNVPLLQSGLDLAMLFSHNGVQRSRSQWRMLLEAAGLRVVKMWTPPGIGNAIIEAEVATG